MDKETEKLVELLFVSCAAIFLMGGWIFLIIRDSNLLEKLYSYLFQNPMVIFYIFFFLCFIGIIIISYKILKMPKGEGLSYKEELRLKMLEELEKFNKEFDKELNL